MLMRTEAFRSSTAAPPSVITEDARTPYAGVTGAAVHTFNHTAGASADFVGIKLTLEATVAVSAVRWGGAAGQLLTKDAGSERSETNRKTSIWYGTAIATGTQQVHVTLGGTDNLGAEAVTLIGVDQASPIADSDSGFVSSDTVVNLDSALVPDGTCWLEVCGMHDGDTPTATTNGSETETADFDAGDHRSVHSFQADVVSNVTPGWTFTSSGLLVMSAVLLRAA